MMQAAVYEGPGKLALKMVPIPKLTRADQVLIEVEACSICGTDVHITATPPGYDATPGTILGHEFCGRVVEVGSAVARLAPGDRVVINPNECCSTCAYCQMNLPNECAHIKALGIDYHGAFAKYCRVSAQMAHKISKDVPAVAAACAEPLACAVNGLNKVRIKPGDSAVVIGAGPIGLIIAMLIRASGAGKIIISETAPYRAEFARSLDPSFVVLNPRTDSIPQAVLAQTQVGADVVFDVTGAQMPLSIDLVRKGGAVVLFGVNKRATCQLPQHLITTKEIRVLGTWLANATFPQAVRILEQKVIPIEKLVTQVIDLAQLPMGIAKLAQGEAVKIVVMP